MLAMATGWTPDVLADLPTVFRAACHWALYVRALVGNEGLPSTDLPRTATAEQRVMAARMRSQVGSLRAMLFPEDEGGEG